MAWRIGIDSGGTFTDVCLFDGKSGRIAVWKVSSTTADPSLAIAEGLGEALAQIGVNASDVCPGRPNAKKPRLGKTGFRGGQPGRRRAS